MFERFHQWFDQSGVLAGHRRGDDGGDRGEVEAQVDGRAVDHHDVPDPFEHLAIAHRRPVRRCPTRGRHAAPAALPRRPGTPARRARRSAVCDASATPAGREIGRRSISRTRKRKERERAATRSKRAARPTPAPRRAAPPRPPGATPGGATARRHAGPARRGRRSAARRPRPRRPRTSPPGAARCRRSRPGALHRVDQVVGDLDAVERLGEARRRSSRRRGRGRRARRRRGDALARAGEAAHGVAVADEPRDERRADVAGHAGDEGLHPLSLTGAKGMRAADLANAGENVEKKPLFAGKTGNPCVLRERRSGRP